MPLRDDEPYVISQAAINMPNLSVFVWVDGKYWVKTSRRSIVEEVRPRQSGDLQLKDTATSLW